MQQGIQDERMLDFLTILYTSTVVDLAIFFLVPNDRKNASLATNAMDFLQLEWCHFREAYEKRWPPLHIYLHEDGNPLVDLKMQDISSFCNRVHVIWNKKSKAAMIEEIEDTGAIARYLDPDEFFHYERQLYFSSLREFGVQVMTAAVRAAQFEQGQYMALTEVDIRFAAVMTFRGRTINPKDASRDQGLVQKSFYLLGYFPRDVRLSAPLENSEWHVEFDQKFFGVDSRRRKAQQWSGFVKQMTEHERQITGANFMLVAVKPREGQFISAMSNFGPPDHKRMKIGHMVQEINNLPTIRTLAACRSFIDDARNDLDDLRNALVFNSLRKAQKPVDLAVGTSDAAVVRQQMRAVYENAVSHIRPYLNPDQARIMEVANRKITDQVLVVHGGPGCIKTSTMVRSLALLTLVDHKFLVLGKDNTSLDKFMKSLEDARHEIMDILYANRAYEVASILAKKKFLRFVPPAYERQSLVKQEIPDFGNFKAGVDRDPRDWEKDSRASDLMAAYTGLEKAIQDDDEISQAQGEEKQRMELLRATQKAQTTTIPGQLDRIRADYDRLALKQSKFFDYPVQHSIPYHVRELMTKADYEKGHEELQSQLNAYIDAQGQVMNEPEDTDARIRQSNAKLLRRTTDTVIAAVLSEVDVVATTYVNAGSKILRDNFRPSCMFHEDASRVDMPSAMIGLAWPDILVHMIVGDTNQLQPFHTGSVKSEFREFVKFSLLHYCIQKEFPYEELVRQYRCHPSIMQFWNEQLYGGRLIHDESTREPNDNRCIFQDMIRGRYKTDQDSQYFLVSCPDGISTAEGGGMSLQNWATARAIVNDAKELVSRGMPQEKITVISYYRGNLRLIDRMVREEHLELTAMHTTTVDLCQGEDNSIVLVDTTATAHGSKISSLLSGDDHGLYQDLSNHVKSPNRACLAGTRAQDGLLFYGEFKSLREAAGKDKSGWLLAAQIDDAKRRNIMLINEIEDENPLILQRLQDPQAQAEYQEIIENAKNLSSMMRFRHRKPDANVQTYGKAFAPRVSYSGPEQGKVFGNFPTKTRQAVKARAEQLAEDPAAEPAKKAGPQIRTSLPKKSGKKRRSNNDG